GLAGDPSWIDHAIGKNKRVEFLYTTDIDVDQHILWQDEFWNRSVRRVFGVTSQDPSIPDVTAPLDASGRIIPQLPASSLDGPPPATVTATVGRLSEANGVPTIGRVWARKTWVVGNGTTHDLDFALRPGPFQVSLSVSPTFVPTTYGLPDTRALGVQPTFTLTR